MLEEIVSLYAHAKDRLGIGQISLGEFFLDGAYASEVNELRDMVKQLGAKQAKESERYHEIKSKLPAVTVSGLFSRRKGDCLIQHSGYICLDIDLGDNTHLKDFNRQVMFVLRHRPEVALAMHSCSGTGYFALVPLVFPAEHKRQFRALQYQYKEQGIIIDKACSDITRLRFATYDDNPYINEHAIPFEDMDAPEQRVVPKYNGRRLFSYSIQDTEMKVEKIICRIEQSGRDVTGCYQDCFKLGLSLKSLGSQGLMLWWRLCQLRSADHTHWRTYNELERNWKSMGESKIVTIEWFFAYMRDHQIDIR